MTQTSPLGEFLRRSPLGRWGLAVTILLIVAALLAPWIAPQGPAAQNLPARLLGPDWHHPFGTDELGRDVLARTLYGARISLLVGFSVVLGAGVVGLVVGAIAGYFGGWFDGIVNVLLINAFLSFPGILLAIAFAAFLGPGLDKVILALVVTGWAGYARLARAQVLKVKEMEFVLAARSLGASHTRILLRHPCCQQYAAPGAHSGDHRFGERHPGGIHAELPKDWACWPRRQVGAPCSTTRATTSSTRRTWSSSRRWGLSSPCWPSICSVMRCATGSTRTPRARSSRARPLALA